MPWIVPAIGAAATLGSAAIAANASRSTGLPSGLGSQQRWTPYSNVNSIKTGPNFHNLSYWPGFTQIDPSIRELRRQTLTNLPGYRNTINTASSDLNTSLGDIRSQLTSNANPFMQARVNPLLERGARTRGDLVQGLTQRGIFGPLYQQSLGAFETDLSRAEGDQRALATQETLSALLGIDTQRYNAALSSVQALQGLDSAQQSIAAQDLAQELSALGLSQADTAAIIQAAGLNMKQDQLNQAMQGRGLYALGSGLQGLSQLFQPEPKAYNSGWDSSWGDIGL